MFPRQFLTLLAAAALACPVSAQSEKLDLRTLSLGSTDFPQLWAMNAATPVEIAFSTIQPSEPLRLNRTDPLRIFKGALNDKGQPADPTPTLVKLPTDSSILLLGWMVADTPRFFPIPDPFTAARTDDWLVINSTAKNVAIQIGATPNPPPSSPRHTPPSASQHPSMKGPRSSSPSPRIKAGKPSTPPTGRSTLTSAASSSSSRMARKSVSR